MKVWYDRGAGAFYLSRAAVPEQFLAQKGRVIELAPARATLATQAMADCMDMVRTELVEMGIIDKSVAPMFISEAVCAYFNGLRDWINVRQRLPHIAGKYLVMLAGVDRPRICQFTREGKFYGRIDVTHWMPLPGPPKT